ncbi:MAG TPA: COR domain-containing protein [Streptosporangiaceae bacterium]|nr:COR domain-containing protein [Streptosporangiaceae bacterium]
MATDPLARIEEAMASRASSLDLAGLGLESLPPALSRLTQLTGLNLARNHLASLPDWIGGLTSLTRLNLTGNRLAGLPDRLGDLTALTELSLRGNHLTALPDALGNLSALADLDVTGNRLTALPDRIGDLTALASLDLTRNRLTRLPARIGDLRGLLSLSLTRNQLIALPEEIGRLVQLIHLHLAWNVLTTLPDSIGRLKALTRLDLSHNDLRSLPARIGDLLALTRLDLDGDQLTQLPESIGHLPLLNRLDLTGNQLTELPESIGHLPLLNRLDVTGNQITTLPISLGSLRSLGYLVLADNQLTGLPDELAGLANLVDLDLSGNQVTALPDRIGDLSSLTYLNVAGNRLTRLPVSIGNLPAISYLNVSANELNDLPDRIGELSTLAQLDLSGNHLSNLPRSLACLSQTVIALSGNPLVPELQAAYEEGPDELNTFLRLLRDEGEFIHEAKLVLVGEGAVGKSTLLAALRGEEWVADRPTTHGVEIKPLVLRSQGAELTLNGWDFGGQRAYRPTHQLFFSASALYLVVWNPRVGPERNFVDYWIGLIRHRAGRSARILVVATHGGAAQRGAYLDEAGLRTRYGEMIVGFHHIDSLTRLGIDELLEVIAGTAIALPHIGRWYPASWRRLRQELRQRDEPYLSYDAYVSAAQAHGISRIAAMSLARNANALGHWIYYADDQRLSDLVIFKPDWLSTAISFALDDLETNRANGLLPHYRLPQLWNDPARAPEQNYPSQIYPVFLQLMERFDISYQVIDRSGRGEPTSLIAQLVPAGRPDLAAWDGYHPEFETRTQICEIVEARSDVPAIPEGLMYQLIVRFHRFSLGRDDYRKSVHWQAGIILDDDYNGRAIIIVERNRVQVKVRAPYPQFLLHRITQDIRDHVQAFWKGLEVRVMVPCDSECEDVPGTGLFDVAKLIHSREWGREEYPCSRCPKWQNIDRLLLGTPRVPPTDEDRLVRAVREAMAPEFSGMLSRISASGRLAEGAVNRQATEIKRAISQTEERYRNLILALDDEAREGPRLFSLVPLKPSLLHPGIAMYSVRLTLWCEHSRLPVHVLNAGRPPTGIYEIDVPREWLVKAAPWIRVTSILVRNLLPVSLDGLKISLPHRDWRALADQLQLAEDSLDALTGIPADSLPDDQQPAGLAPDGPDFRLDGSLLRTVHAFLREKDPSFAGLERVRDRDRYRWVHPGFVSYYRPPPPVVPLQQTGN